MFRTFKLLNDIEKYEVKSIKNEIENFDGVYNAEIEENTKKIVIEYNSDATTEDELQEEIEEMGYDVRVD